METDCGKDPLPHHEQQPLCTSRLPYRQGKKLTATKVYTINNESNHLLVFGVPSINIRQETKNLFIKFGKLLKFNITKEYKTEKFTETYHATYENIKSARIAKKYIDTKNFYGGTIHVCYAPELESIDETRKKLNLRKKDVLSRLKNIEKEKEFENKKINNQNTKQIKENYMNPSIINTNENKTINMGYENIIYLNDNRKRKNDHKIHKNKQKSKTNNHNESIYNDNEFSTNHNKPSTNINVYNTNHNQNSTKDNESGISSQFGTSNMVVGPIYYNNPSITDNESSISTNKPCTSHHKSGNTHNESYTRHNESGITHNESYTNHNESGITHNESYTNHNEFSNADNIEIIDFTSADRETISNINEALNYNKFGNEVIKKIEKKTLNRIKFNINK